jgi:hypothetical protein
MIATLAAGNQIIPRGLPSARAWQHMIERQLRGRILRAAILAGRVVTQKNVLPRKRSTFKRNVDVLSQTNNRSCVNGEFLRMEDVTIVLLYARHPLENHHDGAPFGAHIDGLKGSIQN